MAILQAILDAQARLDAAVAANTVKVDALLAGQAGGMTLAEQQAVADAITVSITVLETTNNKA